MTKDDAWFVKQAKEEYGEGGSVEIDDDAEVSRPKDMSVERGAYVQAWVWVSLPEEEDECNTVPSA